MSVNYYNAETDELSPLSPAYRSLPIIDVDTLPLEDIKDAIYCVATDNYIRKEAVMSNSDMTVNTAALATVGFDTPTVSGSIYEYVPVLYTSIRYLNNSSNYEITKVVVDSSDWSIIIYDKWNNPILTAFLDAGMTIIFYSAIAWRPVGITLSHTNMSTNTSSLTSVGFSASQNIDVYTYKPDSSRFKYDNQYVNQITINGTTGVMVITSPEGVELYNDVIVDGIYDFLYASALEYWIGSAPRQTYERLAKATDMDVDELTDEQLADLITIIS